ncbi:RNA-dependent RNA polymerase, partial [viral metagenome]
WNSKWGEYNDEARNAWAKGTYRHKTADLVQTLYLANMVGRPHRDVAWDDEVQKRLRVLGEIKVARRGEMVELTEDALRAAIWDTLNEEARFRKPKHVKSFEKFYSERAAWMIKGSASGERMLISEYKSVVSEIKKLGVEVRHNITKTDVAEYVSFQDILSVVEDVAIHLAKAHTKGNEHGKLRAIYGSLYSHYVLGSYWSEYLESTLTFKSASMNKDNSQLLKETNARMVSCSNGVWIVCLDYSDFNAQHSNMAQRLVIETIYKWALSKGFPTTAEFDQIATWYAQSFENQWFQRPDTKEWVKIKSGMFSGVRQTTLINTVLNLTYHRLYLRSAYDLGSKVDCLNAYVLGDDGWAEFTTEADAKMYVTVALMGGMEINPLKQLISQGRGEYLRLIYDRDSTVRGCAVRSLSSMVHGNVENNQPSVARQRISELYSQSAMLARRGLDRETMHRIFEDLALYEVDIHGDVPRSKGLKYLYGEKKSGAMGLMPLSSSLHNLKDTENAVDTHEDEESDAHAVARILEREKLSKRFMASADFVSQAEETYGIVWVHDGKNKATALLAAENLTEGRKMPAVQHRELVEAVARSTFNKAKWRQCLQWKVSDNGPAIGADNIEKQFGKRKIKDDKLLAIVTKLGKLHPYIKPDVRTFVEQQISQRLSVPLAAVAKAFQSMGHLKGDQIDYIPTPWLVPELEGIYTQWLVIQNDTTRQLTIPRWIAPMSEQLLY